ncbi:extracytoplasmic function sigma factor VreI [Blastochloris viridis]|uniref:Extracytoplasmic function sigma factor VreI n=2 Tax=Blastochloris viridis TaxID=1079 RepID=A0A182D4E2_BLAVI|nr:extracytoplasmic function sigma factor VreI [Blastochloris viridis]
MARLTRRLGSAELAGEALQDTWIRLQTGDGIAAVRNHDAYLFRIAVNIARDSQRAENRRLTTAEVKTLLNVADNAPDPARVAEARSDLAALRAVMAELPPRQRAILLAARLDELPRREIARRYQISLRLVQRELQEAQDYCAARLKRSTSVLFTSPAREASLGDDPVGAERVERSMSGTEE